MTAIVLSPGELNRRITLQTRTSTQDTYGQAQDTWTDWATCWAKIESMSGNEMVAAQAINAELTHKVTIRYRPGVLASMRLLYGDRIFNIGSVVEPEAAHVSLELTCGEGLNRG